MKLDGRITATIITCTAWLLEFYELRNGEVSFSSGKQRIHPVTKRFGVFYPPFSITQLTFQDLNTHLLGIASDEPLPSEFTAPPVVFEVEPIKTPANSKEAISILAAAVNRQPIDANPEASVLALKTKRLIDDNHLADPSIARIAKRLGVSHPHLSRQFKRDFGMTPTDYLRKLRVADAPLRLARGEQIISVSGDVGYNDLSRFYKQFRKTTNTSPGACKTMLLPRRS